MKGPTHTSVGPFILELSLIREIIYYFGYLVIALPKDEIENLCVYYKNPK